MSLAGPLCALLSSCTWALGISSYARLSKEHAPATINATRAAVAAPLFLITFLVTGGGVGPALHATAAVPPGQVGFLALSILSSYALGDVIFLRAARALGVPAALAIASTYPLWAAVGGLVFRDERLGPVRLAGVSLVVAGTILVILASGRAGRPDAPANAAVPPPASLLAGILLALLASGLWALNAVSLGIGGAGLPTTLASLVRMLFALLLCPLVARLGLAFAPGPGAGARPPPLLLPWSALRRGGPALLLESFAGTLLFTYGLVHAPVSIGAALSSLAPVIAVPIAVATGAERFSPGKTLGALCVVAGIYLLVGA